MLFHGAIPTQADVKRLEEKFGVPEIGTVLKKDEIAAVLLCDCRSSRYRVVTSAWRRRLLRENNIDLGAINGVGFKALEAGERVEKYAGGFKSGLRKIGRAATRMACVEPMKLTDEQRRTQDHVVRTGAMLKQQAALAARSLQG